MARVIGGISTSHVPTIGLATTRVSRASGVKPLFDGYKPVRLAGQHKPDAADGYNDHARRFLRPTTFRHRRQRRFSDRG